jgi:prevent-host-death family protein
VTTEQQDDTVGIRELKARLSHYVARARQGHRVLVTDRGRPVAELVGLDPESEKLFELLRGGRIEWSGGKPRPLRGVVMRGEPLALTVLEQRR